MRALFISILFIIASSSAHAQLEMWKDYEPSKKVLSVTTVKVDSNMRDVYLEGLSETWAPSMEAQKKLGLIEDYWIYASELPNSGDFNLILGVEYADSEATEYTKERHDAFMKEMTKASVDKADEKARTEYPSIRTITGEYALRKITLK